jgi:hypothetical protein
MAGTLLLGTSQADITPQKPIPLCGFSFREGNFESIRGALYLRCFIFRYPEEDIVAFSADLLCWGRDTAANCRALLARSYPHAGRSRFLFLATHNHCGPSVTFYIADSCGGPADVEYIELLENKVLETALAAAENIRPVKAVLYTGKTGIPINRRLKTEKGFIMGPNPEGPKNDDIKLIEFIAAEEDACFHKGEPAALWACASCHPTASGDNRVDREFFVRGLDYFMEAHAPKALGAFIQGCCGDVRPPLIRDGAFYRGSLDTESEELARRFAGELEQVRKGGGASLDLNTQGVWNRSTAELPFNPDFPHKDRNSLVRLDNEIGEWARHFQDASVPKTMTLELFFFNLSRELAMLFLSGEIVAEYSLYCREISAGRVWTGAYAGGITTYIPTAAQLGEGGYEPYDCLFYFLQPAPFNGSAEGVLKEKIRALVLPPAGNER